MFPLAITSVLAALALLFSSASVFAASCNVCGNSSHWAAAQACGGTVVRSGGTVRGNACVAVWNCSECPTDENRDDGGPLSPMGGTSPTSGQPYRECKDGYKEAVGPTYPYEQTCQACDSGKTGVYVGATSSCVSSRPDHCTSLGMYSVGRRCTDSCPSGQSASMDSGGRFVCGSDGSTTRGCALGLAGAAAAIGFSMAVGCSQGATAGSPGGPLPAGTGCAAGALAGMFIGGATAWAACSAASPDPVEGFNPNNPPPFNVTFRDADGNIVGQSNHPESGGQAEVDCRTGQGCSPMASQAQDWSLGGNAAGGQSWNHPSGTVCSGGWCGASNGDGTVSYVGPTDDGGFAGGVMSPSGGDGGGSSGGGSGGGGSTGGGTGSNGLVTIPNGQTWEAVRNPDGSVTLPTQGTGTSIDLTLGGNSGVTGGTSGGGSSGGGSSGGDTGGGTGTGDGSGTGDGTGDGQASCGSLACESTLQAVRDALVDTPAAVRAAYDGAVASSLDVLNGLKDSLSDTQEDSFSLVDDVFHSVVNPFQTVTGTLGNCVPLDYTLNIPTLGPIRLYADVCEQIDVIHWAFMAMFSMVALLSAFNMLFKET